MTVLYRVGQPWPCSRNHSEWFCRQCLRTASVLAYSRWHLRHMYERPGMAGEAEREESAREADRGGSAGAGAPSGDVPSIAVPSSDSSLQRASLELAVHLELGLFSEGASLCEGKLSEASARSHRRLLSLSGEGHIASIIDLVQARHRGHHR